MGDGFRGFHTQALGAPFTAEWVRRGARDSWVTGGRRVCDARVCVYLGCEDRLG